LSGEKFGELSKAMICAGTIMVCVTRSRAMISIASSASNWRCRT
jgi:hypothetical protein